MKIILIDAKNALFRYGWAFKTLQTSDGTYTGAVYGILGLLQRLKRHHSNARFAMVWDGEGKSWRHDYWAGYKSNRVKNGPIADGVKRILAQISTVTEATTMLGIPQFRVPRLEGDDAIALVAKRLIGEDHEVIIYSSDKDFLQLMPLGVKVIHNAEEPVNVGWVNLKFRCAPDKVLLVRSIAGDPSDAIPGILEGVGVVRAADIINAGCNPSYSDFEMHDLRLQRAWKHLIPRWDEIHRNYTLMKLVDFNTLPKRYSVSECHCIGTAIEDCVKSLLNYSPGHRYRSFLQMMGALEMAQFISERHSLWQLQRLPK